MNKFESGRIGRQYTGKDLEADLIGGVKTEGRDRGHLDYASALKKARKNQPENWNPEDPPLELPNTVLFFTQEALSSPEVIKKLPKEIAAGLDNGGIKLKVFTAAGSNLDHHHQVDFFLSLEREITGNKMVEILATVTIDLTMNEEKDTYKADVVMQVPADFAQKSGPQKEEILKSYTKDIIESLIFNIQYKPRLVA